MADLDCIWSESNVTTIAEFYFNFEFIGFLLPLSSPKLKKRILTALITGGKKQFNKC